ncbi:MAG: 2-amino-4-hydroxy-6-hydroxymethyldihydropteridine diphosphokinase [Nitrospirota bacterium]
MSVVYIGIGSNLGDRHKNCEHAIELLEKRGIIVKKKSSMHETAPWGIKDQPVFINMVIEIETGLKPKELLRLLKDVEKEAGRKETFKWGPRIIDLDILLFDDIVLNENDLKIPHPSMHKRDFVLMPLCEIAPDIKHPVLNLSVKDLMQKLSNGQNI